LRAEPFGGDIIFSLHMFGLRGAMGFDKAVFIIGPPSFVFESATSIIARAVESFGVEEAEVFFSEFA